MRSIDTYLCKEKKEVHKVSIIPALVFGMISQDAIEAANKQQELINEYRRKCKEAKRVIWAKSLLAASGFW